MASVSTATPSARLRWKNNARLLLPFCLALAALGALAWRLQVLGYVSQDAISLQSKLLVLRDVAGLHIEYLGFQAPPAWLYLSALVASLPGLSIDQAPYLVDVLAVSGLLTLAWRDMARQQGVGWACLGTALLLANPLTWWAATAGANQGLGLLAVFMLVRALASLRPALEVFSYLRVAGWLCVLWFVDHRALILSLALLPWLPFLAPRDVFRRAPVSFYLICYLPLLFAFGSWMYLNWLFLGDPLVFLQDAWSGFRGGYAQLNTLPWLQRFGGQWLSPLVVLIPTGVVLFPVLAVTMGSSDRDARRTVLVCVATVLTASVLATVLRFSTQPSDMLVLLLPVTALVLAAVERPRRVLAVTLMLAGGLLGMWLLPWNASEPLRNWMSAVQGMPPPVDEDAVSLGRWLTENPRPTMLDDRAGYAVIAASGSAESLILPFSWRFKQAMHDPASLPEQVMMVDPGTKMGQRGTLNRRFPTLWSDGWPGYELAFEQGPYRVWRQRAR